MELSLPAPNTLLEGSLIVGVVFGRISLSKIIFALAMSHLIFCFSEIRIKVGILDEFYILLPHRLSIYF